MWRAYIPLQSRPEKPHLFPAPFIRLALLQVALALLHWFLSVHGREKEAILKETADMWKDRKDMKDPAEWVRKTRAKMSSRYEKIFD